MTVSKEGISHQPDQQPTGSVLLRFEDTEGSRRRLLASSDIIPVLVTLKRNINRYGMGGIQLIETEDQNGAGDLKRMELTAVYSHPLDFLVSEMERAVVIWTEFQVQGVTKDEASGIIDSHFSPERMKVRFGEFYAANRQEVLKEQNSPLGNS